MGNGKPHFFQQADVFNHPPLGLIEAVFDRVPHSRETFQFGGIKAKETRILDQDQQALVIVLDSSVKRSRVKRAMTE